MRYFCIMLRKEGAMKMPPIMFPKGFEGKNSKRLIFGSLSCSCVEICQRDCNFQYDSL